jgi:O-antigen/teichoic acid export membrane protein
MAELGMYALAKSLAEMPNTFLSKVIQPIILPTLARMQDSKAKLKESILILTKWAMILGLPFISFFVIFASPILSMVYGSKYIIVAVPFGLLSVYSLILLCSSFIMNVFIAIGQPDIQRIASFTRTALFLIIIYPATHFGGLSGAACAVLAAMLVLLGVQIFYVKRLLQIGYLEYCSVCLQGIKLSMIVIVPGCIINIFIQPQPLTGFIAGIVLCFIAWSFAIAEIVQSYKKGLLQLYAK